jgi:hypothetical protein
MATSTNVRLKACPACKVRKPECDFPPSDISLVCKRCLPRAQYSQETQRAFDELEKDLARILDRHHVPALKRAPRMDEMLALLMDKFGGVHSFVNEYVNQIKQLAAAKPGHPETVRAFAGVMKQIHENNKRVDENARAGMSLEQVDEAISVALVARIAEIAIEQGQSELRAKLLDVIRGADEAARIAYEAEAAQVVESVVVEPAEAADGN